MSNLQSAERTTVLVFAGFAFWIVSITVVFFCLFALCHCLCGKMLEKQEETETPTSSEGTVIPEYINDTRNGQEKA